MPRPEPQRVPTKPVVCVDCGVGFLARRSDAKRCAACAVIERQRIANRPRPKRYKEPGVGKGHYTRVATVDAKCERCGVVFQAKRAHAKWCPACRPAAERERQHRHDAARPRIACIDCGQLTVRRATRCAACWGKHLSSDQNGEHNPSWKGGKTLSKAGYHWVRVGGKYEQEHRYVWEQAHGPLPDGYVVHHLNGNKLDNRIENLAAMPRHQHHKEPREALRPYEAQITDAEARIREREARIRELEAEVERLRK